MVDAMAAWTVEVRAAAALAATGAWTVLVPFLGRALDLTVDVAFKVEVVDHVIPGAVTAIAAGLLLIIARRGPLAGNRIALLTSGVCFLAGFWVFATHAPLVADAVGGDQSWDAAIWHSVASLPLVGLSLWCVLRSTPPP